MPLAWPGKRPTDVAGRVPAGVVIACDTIVECGGEILGKPADVADARRMLLALSGQVHHVYSGLCVWPRPDGQPAVRTAETRLVMSRLSADVLDEYLASGAVGRQGRSVWLSGSDRLAGKSSPAASRT